MNQDHTSVIFIPEIIGFTQFVNQTEIKHGQHIFSEIPEIIINSNTFSLQVAEIEGDAAFFYREKCLMTFDTGCKEYPDMGVVNHTYSVTPFRDFFSTPEPPQPPPKNRNPLIREVPINRPVAEVYALLMHLDLRLFWNEGPDKLEYEPNRVNRVGTRRTCLFPVGTADFTTVLADFDEDSRVYGEELENPSFARKLFIYCVLSPHGEFTKLRTELHFFAVPVIVR
ncbi:MAG: DUF2652 domain-containing protein [Bacteroidota bacterium]